MISVSLWILVTTASVQAFIGSQACLALLHSPYVMPSLVAGFKRSLHRAIGSRKTWPLSSCNAIHKKFEKEAPRAPYALKKVIIIPLSFEEHAIRQYKRTSRTFALIYWDFKMVFQSSSWKISFQSRWLINIWTLSSIIGPRLEKTIIQKDTCTPMFTAALFTIARIWKQLKCPSTAKWIKTICCIYTAEF